jgi:hypothetical protein
MATTVQHKIKQHNLIVHTAIREQLRQFCIEELITDMLTPVSKGITSNKFNLILFQNIKTN